MFLNMSYQADMSFFDAPVFGNWALCMSRVIFEKISWLNLERFSKDSPFSSGISCNFLQRWPRKESP
jgi:hypothetical protein